MRRARDSRRSTVTCTSPPRGVNFTALESRFETICCSRSGSPRMGTATSGSETSSLTPLASAGGRITSTAASIAGASSTGRSARRHSPETIRDTSRRSSISWACALALCSMAARAAVLLSERSSPVRSMFDHATIGVSGVLSSCETVARNSSFARLASSARWRASSARSRYRSRSASARLRSVMSCTSTMAWSIAPCGPGRPRTETIANIASPSFRMQRVSRRSGAPLPERIRLSRAAKAARSSWCTMARQDLPSSSMRV